jgi:hypothetical protein
LIGESIPDFEASGFEGEMVTKSIVERREYAYFVVLLPDGTVVEPRVARRM